MFENIRERGCWAVWLGWWLRRHFQKNSLMLGTFVPPEMY